MGWNKFRKWGGISLGDGVGYVKKMVGDKFRRWGGISLVDLVG